MTGGPGGMTEVSLAAIGFARPDNRFGGSVSMLLARRRLVPADLARSSTKDLRTRCL